MFIPIFLSRSEDHRRQQDFPFPWQIPILALEIAILTIVSLVWAVCLFRKGRKLKMRPEFAEPVEDEVWSVNVARCEEPRESALLRKSKQLQMARLSYDDDEIDEKEKALRDHLASEYERIQKSEGPTRDNR